MPEVDGVKVEVELIEGDGEVETDLKPDNTSSSTCSEIPSLLGNGNFTITTFNLKSIVFIFLNSIH